MVANWGKRIFITVVAVSIAAGFYMAFRSQPIPVDTAEVKERPLEVTVNEEGVTRIREIYTVSAPVTGRVLRSPREVGDRVEENKTLVATLEPVAPSFLDERSRKAREAAVKAAEASEKLAKAKVTSAKAELGFAESDLKRAEKLAKRRTISDRTLEQARLHVQTKLAALETASAELDVRRQEVSSARANLIEPGTSFSGKRSGSCCVQVLAPVSGQVLKIITESEKVVAPGTPILEIGDPHDLEIIADLLSSDAVRVREGAEVRVENWGGEGILKARVRKIEPAGFMKVSSLGIEEQRVKVRIDIEDPPEKWQRLGHDYRVFVRVTVWTAKDALTVPISALFRKGESWAVFLVEDAEATLRKIEIGKRNTELAEIKSGLAKGDKVVLHPSDRLISGARIIERTKLD